MAFIKKNNTWIFIGIVLLLTLLDLIFWGRLSLVRKLVNLFAIFAALHEIEEKVWPGGFYELMLKKFGMKREEVDLDRGTLGVSVYWIILLGSAYLFDNVPLLLCVPIALFFFEAFIHTAGIKIHHLKKPYTPGLVTAYCLAACAVVAIRAMNAAGLVTGKDYALGAVLWVLSFLCLEAYILTSFGKKPKELFAQVRGNK